MGEASGNGVDLDLFVPGDAYVLCEVDRDPEHRRRFDFPPDFTPSLQHSMEVIARWERERQAGIRFAFAVRNGSGHLVGGCELLPVGDRTANVSYWTHPLHRGHGVASEALRRICAVAARLGFRRLEIVTDVDNIASRRVALHNGFNGGGARAGRALYILEVARPPSA